MGGNNCLCTEVKSNLSQDSAFYKTLIEKKVSIEPNKKSRSNVQPKNENLNLLKKTTRDQDSNTTKTSDVSPYEQINKKKKHFSSPKYTNNKSTYEARSLGEEENKKLPTGFLKLQKNIVEGFFQRQKVQDLFVDNKGLIFLKKGVVESRLRKDERLREKVLFDADDYSVSNKQAVILWSHDKKKLYFRCISRNNPCSLVMNLNVLQLQKGNILIAICPNQKKFYIQIHRCKLGDEMEEGIMTKFDKSLTSCKSNSQYNAKLDQLRVILIEGRAKSKLKVYQFAATEEPFVNVGCNKEATIMIKMDTGGNENRSYFSIEFCEQFGWLIRRESIQEGFKVELLIKNIKEMKEGVDSQRMEFKSGMNIRIGDHILKLDS